MANSSAPKGPGFFAMAYTFKPKDQAVHHAGRLAGFTDAILAIAATLTVLDLKGVTESDKGTLWHQISVQKPLLLSAMLGFLWITGAWVLSHRAMRQLRGVDHYMTLLIISRALVITLIPFATSLLASGFNHPDFWVGVEAVSIVILIETVIGAFSTDYAHRRGLLAIPATEGQRRAALTVWAIILGLTVLACVSAPFSPWFALSLVILTRVSSVMPLGSDRKGLPGDLDAVNA